MKTKISSFLKERPNRFKPAEAVKLGLKRIYKITQNGEIFISDKPSNTNMILVKPGDLVISGIGIAKGGGNSLNVYEGKEDVLTTIHYSSYIIDKKLISKEFLKIFLISPHFRRLLQENSPNGIKAEIKPKHFLPIELELPSIELQDKIVQKINSMKNEIKQLGNNILEDKKLLSSLRQSILSEAVQGKLIPQNSEDEPASELLKRIKKEKEKLIKEGKIRKGKELPPIEEDEAPYGLPNGWVWCRLGDVCKSTGGNGFPLQYQGLTEGKFPFYKVGDLSASINEVFVEEANNWITDENLIKKFTLINEGGIVFPKIGGALLTNNRKILSREGFIDNNCMALTPHLKLLEKYLFLFMKTIDMGLFCQGTSMPSVSQGTVNSMSFPLPPLPEQRRIVDKVDSLMKFCDELELRIRENKESSGKLMGAVLRESFEE